MFIEKLVLSTPTVITLVGFSGSKVASLRIFQRVVPSSITLESGRLSKLKELRLPIVIPTCLSYVTTVSKISQIAGLSCLGKTLSSVTLFITKPFLRSPTVMPTETSVAVTA